jgi:hypothetical protein
VKGFFTFLEFFSTVKGLFKNFFYDFCLHEHYLILILGMSVYFFSSFSFSFFFFFFAALQFELKASQLRGRYSTALALEPLSQLCFVVGTFELGS